MSLTRYALFLRGVNVGTKNSLPMPELRAMLEAAGCTQVETYVQSGNAVFTTKLGAATILSSLERALAARMGRPIDTTLRTGPELRAVLAANPFPDVVTKPSGLCVTFLSKPPTATALAPLLTKDFTPERVAVHGREIYTWHPNGQGRSPLAKALGQLRLEGTVTTRNWTTVTKLLERLEQTQA